MYEWIDRAQARRRLQEIERERQLLLQILGEAPETAAAVPARGGPRRRRRGGPSLIALTIEALRSAGKDGATVGDILAKLRKGPHAGVVSAPNASAQLSAAISQHLRGKKPVVKVLHRGKPGKPSKYTAG